LRALFGKAEGKKLQSNPDEIAKNQKAPFFVIASGAKQSLTV
jgi:hypothetical protein